MKNTFVATTVYHLYLIILLIEKDRLSSIENDNLLVIIEHTDNLDPIIANLLKHHYFRKVIIIPNKKSQKRKLGKFNYIFNRKKLVTILDTQCEGLKEEENFIANSKIFISDIDSSKNYFYLKFRNKKFSMIEGGSLTYVQIPSKTTIYKKKLLKNGFIENGFDKKVEEVYALSPSKLPKVLAKKAIKIDIKAISKKLSSERIQTIFKVFNFNISLDNKEKKALIVTQNIYDEGFVDTELDKINIYKDLISKIPNEYSVFIKAHPRENTDYSKYLKNVTVFPKSFPAELFLLLGDNTFDLGYTLFSTSLNNLADCVREKKFVALEYIDHFKKNKEQIKEVIKLYQTI